MSNCKVYIETHGCKLNMADSQSMSSEFEGRGFTVSDQINSPDVYILNSCTVTSMADKKARKSLNSAKKRWPNALIVATGCYAERADRELSEMGSVDLVVRGTNKSEIVSSVVEYIGDYEYLDTQNEGNVIGNLLGRTRASIKIQEGCDQVCSYCIVPKVRGRERSVPVIKILESIIRLSNLGVKEVILTGTQLGSYGFETTDMSLAKLIEAILKETDIQRLRVSSIQPQELTGGLLNIWHTNNRLCKHFHLPLQSGSNKILKNMRRRYTSDMFLRSVERIRNLISDASITTDVITGFPGETEEDHNASFSVLERARLADAHVFRYSDRPGTTSFHMQEKVHGNLINQRAFELRKITLQNAKRHMSSFIGDSRPVLWEDNHGKSGLTDNYICVKIDASYDKTVKSKKNEIELVKLVKISGKEMIVESVS